MAMDGWIHDVRAAIGSADEDFFRVSPVRYWSDFLVSLAAAYAAAAVYLGAPLGSWLQVGAFPVAVFWLYRMGSLVHEVCHLGAREMVGFKAAWNVLGGVVILMPSPFFTRHHRDHHSQRFYGTPQDPEYAPNMLQPGRLGSGLVFALKIAALPILVFLRFLLAPLSFTHPRLRDWTLRRASALTCNLRYERRLTPADRRAIVAVEIPCFLRALAIPLMVAFGVHDWTRVPLLYVLAVATVTLNHLRFFADHHGASDGGPVALDRHIADSCNFTGRDPLTMLMFPFSIRYHALHHLFPSLPYHNLARAHAHLVATLDPDSPYHRLDRPGWWSVARRTIFGGGVPA